MSNRDEDDDTTRRQIYQSVPLDADREEIRLLLLLPGQYDDPVHCELSIATLSPYEDIDLVTSDLFDQNEGPAPLYEALSYTWGSHSPRRKVLLHGRAALQVTDNLFQALRNLRQNDRTRILWIDALCINQRDNDEKSDQVQLMGKIFALASSVLVWLGTNEAHFASSDGSESSSVSGTRTSDECGLNRSFRATEPPWETRIWTVQEFIMARRRAPQICIGREQISCRHALGWHSGQKIPDSKYFAAIQPHLDALDDMRKYMPPGGNDIFQLLPTALRMYASDDRDKVYSLLAVLPPTERQHIQPNYARSTAEVWAKATHASIASRANIDVLLFAMSGLERPPGLPSWAANFGLSTSPAAKCFADAFERVWVPFRPWMIPKEDITAGYEPVLLSDARSLVIYGQPAGRVRVLTHIESLYDKDCLEQLLRLKDTTDKVKASEDPEDGDGAVDRSAGVDFFSERPCDKSRRGEKEDRQLIKTLFESWSGPRGDDTSARDASPSIGEAARMLEVEEWCKFFRATSDNFSVFVTETGLLGIAPADIAVGDEVVQLFGGLAPAVLSSVGEERWVFRGFTQGTWLLDMRQVRTRELADELGGVQAREYVLI